MLHFVKFHISQLESAFSPPVKAIAREEVTALSLHWKSSLTQFAFKETGVNHTTEKENFIALQV